VTVAACGGLGAGEVVWRSVFGGQEVAEINDLDVRGGGLAGRGGGAVRGLEQGAKVGLYFGKGFVAVLICVQVHGVGEAVFFLQQAHCVPVEAGVPGAFVGAVGALVGLGNATAQGA